MTSLNPVLSIGEQIGEAIRLHQDLAKSAGRGESGRNAAAGAHPGAGAARARISAPVVRRHAPARHDRDGARLQSQSG